ncbi:hypothetical protein ACU8KH_05746 [Lachancea thermotolerans]
MTPSPVFQVTNNLTSFAGDANAYALTSNARWLSSRLGPPREEEQYKSEFVT